MGYKRPRRPGTPDPPGRAGAGVPGTVSAGASVLVFTRRCSVRGDPKSRSSEVAASRCAVAVLSSRWRVPHLGCWAPV